MFLKNILSTNKGTTTKSPRQEQQQQDVGVVVIDESNMMSDENINPNKNNKKKNTSQNPLTIDFYSRVQRPHYKIQKNAEKQRKQTTKNNKKKNNNNKHTSTKQQKGRESSPSTFDGTPEISEEYSILDVSGLTRDSDFSLSQPNDDSELEKTKKKSKIKQSNNNNNNNQLLPHLLALANARARSKERNDDDDHHHHRGRSKSRRRRTRSHSPNDDLSDRRYSKYLPSNMDDTYEGYLLGCLLRKRAKSMDAGRLRRRRREPSPIRQYVPPYQVYGMDCLEGSNRQPTTYHNILLSPEPTGTRLEEHNYYRTPKSVDDVGFGFNKSPVEPIGTRLDKSSPSKRDISVEEGISRSKSLATASSGSVIHDIYKTIEGHDMVQGIYKDIEVNEELDDTAEAELPSLTLKRDIRHPYHTSTNIKLQHKDDRKRWIDYDPYSGRTGVRVRSRFRTHEVLNNQYPSVQTSTPTGEKLLRDMIRMTKTLIHLINGNQMNIMWTIPKTKLFSIDRSFDHFLKAQALLKILSLFLLPKNLQEELQSVLVREASLLEI